jgi:K+-dependent Na+/Ca+ exchanger-like protein
MQALGISEDVAGATFMAMGSSAPELFISLMAAFVSEGDAGLGTIVGSAIFNILIIIGLCSFVAAGVKLDWYPLTRDTLFYCTSIIVLVCGIFDSQVQWWEALICCLLYGCYILWMYFNTRLAKICTDYAYKAVAAPRENWKIVLERVAESTPFSLFIFAVITCNMIFIVWEWTDPTDPTEVSMISIGNTVCMAIFLAEWFVKTVATGFCGYWKNPANAFDGVLCLLMIIDFVISEVSKAASVNGVSNISNSVRIVRLVRFLRVFRAIRCLRLVPKATKAVRKIRGLASPRPAGRKLPDDKSNAAVPTAGVVAGESEMVGQNPSFEATGEREPPKADMLEGGEAEKKPLNEVAPSEDAAAEGDDDDDDDGDPNPFEMPSSIGGKILWGIMLPLNLAMYYSVHKFSKVFGQKDYLWSFAGCVIWICIYCFLVDYMAAAIGCTMKIPDAAMGLIFLAAGTSIPDTIASVNVAKKGMGNMAVSNSLGSNVFDILFGLGIPWVLKTLIYGVPVKINSGSLNILVMFLFITVAMVVLCIHATGWQLSKRVGIALVCAYWVVILFMLLLEMCILVV